MGFRRVVVITGISGLGLACAGVPTPCGPLPAEGRPCVIERQCLIPGQADDCGLNGYECDDGEWQALMTYCNPPPMEPEPETCAHITAGAACTDGDSCTIDMPEECGVVGYRCVEGAWGADRMSCNPPPAD